jgi:hypothetical protein
MQIIKSSLIFSSHLHEFVSFIHLNGKVFFIYLKYFFTEKI